MALSNCVNMLGRAPTASSSGVGDVDGPRPGVSTDNALVRWDGPTGRAIQNGVITEDDYTGTIRGPRDQATTTAVGSAFTNQPANDGVEVISSNAGDTTQTVTIIGTTNGSDVVVVETVTLNGTTAVATVKTDWGVVLAVKKSATTLGTVTVREASGDATITSGLTAAVLSVGVTTVVNTAAYNRLISMVADGATTKQLGFQGTNTAGTVIYDSQALTGTTAALSNSSFLTLTEIYRGDLEVARIATVTTNGSWQLIGGGGGGYLSFDTLAGSLTFLSTKTTGTISLQANGSVLTGLELDVLADLSAALNQTENAALSFKTNSVTALTLTALQNAIFAGNVIGAIPVSTTTTGNVSAATYRTAENNIGASALSVRTLPTAVAGAEFTFVVDDTDGIKVVANTGDIIRIAGNTGTAAGFTQSTTVGSVIRLLAIDATYWDAIALVGTWSNPT